jgi:SpoVK/Ycf46/Vps4 family AAA+-type ATPase
MFDLPGTGKTTFAQSLAGEISKTGSGIKFYEVQVAGAAKLVAKEGAQAMKNIQALFNLAYEHAPCVLWLDEIETLIMKQGGNVVSAFSDHNKRHAPGKGVLFLAAANEPWELDPAIESRFQSKYFFNFPSRPELAALLSRKLEEKTGPRMRARPLTWARRSQSTTPQTQPQSSQAMLLCFIASAAAMAALASSRAGSNQFRAFAELAAARMTLADARCSAGRTAASGRISHLRF